MMKRIFSFDVFDTCICRSCGNPDNIFYLLAEWMMPDASETVKIDFIKERKNAESKALSKVLPHQEVTIDNIYDNFDLSVFTQLPNVTVKEKEIELEISSFYPIQRTMQLLDSCRKKGKVIFISDMYLPYKVLYKKLCDLGVICNNETLYLSSDIGLTKRHGELYDYVKQEENIDTHHWTHYGDNLLVDVYIPRRKHIKTVKIDTPSSKYEALIDSESRYQNLLPVSAFSGLLRCHRLGNTLDIQDEFLSDVMAPFVISFALSVLEQAQKDHIKRLYFASRDMYVVYLVAKEFTHLYSDMELRYLNISTRVLFPTTISQGTEEELCEMMQMVYSFKPVSFLKMLGYTSSEIQDISEAYDVETLVDIRKNDVTPLIKLMLKDERRNDLVKRCVAKKKIFLKYLQQEGFYGYDHEKVALVDIGWRTSSQLVLNKILSSDVAYYYYGLSADRFSITDTGERHSFTCEENLSQLYQHREFIEYFICKTPEAMTVGYDYSDNGKIVPIKDQSSDAENDNHFSISNIRKTVNMAREWARMKLVSPPTVGVLFSCVQKILDDFVRHPQPALVSQISDQLVFSHYGKNSPMIKKMTFGNIVRIMSHNYLPFKRGKNYCEEKIWEKASFVYSFGKYGDALYRICHFPFKMMLRTGAAACYYQLQRYLMM